MLKRHGHNVHILEKGTSSARTDVAAGMSIWSQGNNLLEQLNIFARPYSFACPGLLFLDRQGGIKRTVGLPMKLTSWNMLYYNLRANFDHYESEFCPDAPNEKEGEGDATYDLGKCFTSISCNDQKVKVEYDDLVNGGKGSVCADLVIAADGSNSSVRQCLLPNTQHTYAAT